jgi:hypothetical protein
MSLLVPLALLGLLTLPIIILLHILRNRRELLSISSLQLWRELQQRKQGGLPRFILLSLMLFLQLCAATALTLALTRPAFSFLLDQPRQTIFVLDTTTSMTAEDAGQVTASVDGNRRFDVARQFIQNQLQAMDQDDTFAVISLEPKPEILLTGDGEQVAPAMLALENLAPGATGVDLPSALTLANSLVDSFDQEHEIIVLTDGSYPVEAELLPPLLAPITWQIISSRPEPEGRVSNLALLNVSARRLIDDRHRLFVRVVNYGDAPAGATLLIIADGRPVDQATIQLDPLGETARLWTLPARTETVAVELVEPDSLPLDNRAELYLAGVTRHRVLLVSDTPDTLAQALEVQPGVVLSIDSPEMIRFNPTNFDLVVFESIPPALTAWPQGNLLIVNPPLGHPLLPAENFARNLRPDLEVTSALLTGLDLSGVYFSRVSQLTLPDWAEADLMGVAIDPEQETNSDLPLIFSGAVDDSKLVVWAFDLTESNLPARLALPLLTANTLSTLLSSGPPPVVPVGEPVLLNGSYSVEIPGGRRLPPDSAGNELNVFTRTKQPGLYKIYGSDEALVTGFAVQAGSALESNLTTQLDPAALELRQEPERVLASPKLEFEEYWPWLAGLALGAVIIEGWLAWRR